MKRARASPSASTAARTARAWPLSEYAPASFASSELPWPGRSIATSRKRAPSGPSSWREKARADEELPWMRAAAGPSPSGFVHRDRAVRRVDPSRFHGALLRLRASSLTACAGPTKPVNRQRSLVTACRGP